VIRRSLLQLLSGLPLVTRSGDGLSRPLNAPPAVPPGYGTQPGTSQAVVIANRVIIFGSGGGEFVYSGTPALGNLISSDTGAAGTDPYGNAYLQGTTGYDVVLGVYLAKNISVLGLAYYTAASGAGPWTLVARVFWQTQAPNAGLTLATANGNATLSLLSGGGIQAWQPIVAGNALGAETWHNITMDAGWTASAQAPQYRLLPDGDVEARGQATHASVTVVTQINSGAPLPAAYRPAQTRFYRASDPMDSAGLVQIDTAGIFSVRANASFPATQALFDGTYSLA
jgi:hypothetical protein